MSRDRNLLFGILAVQLRLCTPQELVNAGSLWAAQPERGLGDILVELGSLSREDFQMLDALIARRIDAAGGDAAQVYADFGGDAAAQDSFGGSLVFDGAGVRVADADSANGRYASLSAPLTSSRSTPASPAQAGTAASTQGSLPPEHSGRYSVRGEQGRGGIGRVLIVHDEAIGREVALKELLQGKTKLSGSSSSRMAATPTASQTARFLREARITGQLEHPGIVPVYDLGQRADGTVYYTMRLVRGTTLAERLRACHDLSARLALLPHFIGLCQAIAYAHSRGVVHRDIKPANVMAGQFGETVLLDWGLAKVRGQADEGAATLAREVRQLKDAAAGESVFGKPIGTPSYMPPEQADGRIDAIDERSDVWSLGAVLYEVLTGQPPFTGVTAFDVIGAVLTDDVVPVMERCKDAPPELAAVAMRCLQREPARRYTSVEQLAADVTAFTSGGLVSAYSYSSRALATRWARRRWPVLVTAAAALVVLATVVAVAYGQVVEKNRALGQAYKTVQAKSEEMLARRLLAESREQITCNETEMAALLALEAAKHTESMALLESGLRACTGSMNVSRTLPGHTAFVRRVLYSPDGQWLASSACDGTIRLWDRTSQKRPVRILRLGRTDIVSIFTFSPDGKRLLSGSGDSTVQLWDLTARNPEKNCIRLKKGNSSIWCADMAHHEPLVVSGGVGYPAGVMRLWDLRQPDTPLAEITVGDGSISSVAFTPDDQKIIATNGRSAFLVWDRKDLSRLHEIPVPAPILQFSLARDETVLATSAIKRSDGIVRLWKFPELTLLPASIEVKKNQPIWDTCFGPKNDILALCTEDGVIQVWDLSTKKLRREMKNMGHLWSVNISPEKTELAWARSTDTLVHLLDLDSQPTEPRCFAEYALKDAYCAHFTPDGKQIALCCDDGVALVDAVGKERRKLVSDKRDVRAWPIDISADGKTVAVGYNSGRIGLWPIAGGTARYLSGHSASVQFIRFSPNGELLASIDEIGELRLWTLHDESGCVTLQAHAGYANELAFRPDGKQLATTGFTDGKVLLWNLAQTPPESQVLFHDPTTGPFTVGYSPDGAKLVTGGNDGLNAISLWDLNKPGSKPRQLLGHTAGLDRAAFSPDGMLLASCADDATIRIWDMLTLDAAPRVWTGHSGIVSFLSWSADGKQIVSTARDGMRVWTVDPSGLLDKVRQIPRRNLTLAEWQQYVGADVPYERTLPSLPEGFGVEAKHKLQQSR